jgi:hypothetical protein
MTSSKQPDGYWNIRNNKRPAMSVLASCITLHDARLSLLALFTMLAQCAEHFRTTGRHHATIQRAGGHSIDWPLIGKIHDDSVYDIFD